MKIVEVIHEIMNDNETEVQLMYMLHTEGSTKAELMSNAEVSVYDRNDDLLSTVPLLDSMYDDLAEDAIDQILAEEKKQNERS